MSTPLSRQVILLTAGSGNIGSRLVPMLLKDQSNPKIILPTSNASRLSERYSAEASTAKSEIVIEEGDIQDPQWIEQILVKHGVSSVFLCLTSGESELFTTLNFFDSIKKVSTVKHLVYLSAYGDFSLDATKNGALQNIGAAHVAVKFLLEAKLKYGVLPPSSSSGFTYTVIGPTLFFDNDLRSKKSLTGDGYFDEPLSDKGQSRVSPSDIALAVYKSLQDQGQKYHGEKIMIGSQHAYTRQEIADLWSTSLQKPIRIASGTNEEDLRIYEDNVKKVDGGAAWARDKRLMYEAFAAEGFGMTKDEYKKQVEFLGKEPEDYAKFVMETGAKWLEDLK